MTWQRTGFLVLALLASACGGHGTTQFTGSPPSADALGPCALCHAPDHTQFATNLSASASGLQCDVCHQDLTPGRVGPGHRSIPGPDQVPSFAAPDHLLGPEKPFGKCAYCHNQFAVNMVFVSGDLQCQTCHQELLPGQYAPGHQSIPGPEQVPSSAGPTHSVGAAAPFGACAYCHNQFAVNMIDVSGDLKCQNCHQDDLLPGKFEPGHRSLPEVDLVPAFAGPTHSLGAEAGFGYCAYCHNDKAMNMTGSGVAVPCQFCHATALTPTFGPGHRSLPGPQQAPSFVGPSHSLGPESTFGPCGFCHSDIAVKANVSSGHGSLSLQCGQCHTQATPNDYGPGHRNVPACAECHSSQQTHQDPAAGTVFECAVCHTPHGSTNLFLINEEIAPPGGVARSVQFTNLSGLADGSFASVAHPGTGVCETCHTTTQFYRRDGSGDAHFPYTCFTCHPHAGGFAPR